MRRLTVALLALMLATTTAVAGDRPYSWTGFYLGAHGAYSSAEWKGELTYDPGLPCAAFCDASTIFDPTGRDMSANARGGGVQVGYNHQFGQLVIGVEADAAFIGAEDSRTFTSNVAPLVDSYDWDISTKLNGMETLRLRLGYATGPVLWYVTGGVALGHTEGELEVTSRDGFSPAAVTAQGSAKETHVGWTVGGGLEWGITEHISLAAQYLYVDFGSADYHLKGAAYPNQPYAGCPTCVTGPHVTDSFPADLTVHSASVRLNVRLAP